MPFFSRIIVVSSMRKLSIRTLTRIAQPNGVHASYLSADFIGFSCLSHFLFNCCNRLENDESFICWEPGKESVWVRPMPKFAIRNHSMFRMGMTYQQFGKKMFQSIQCMVGLRVAESIQRRQSIAITRIHVLYPIYDWRDSDITVVHKIEPSYAPHDLCLSV